VAAGIETGSGMRPKFQTALREAAALLWGVAVFGSDGDAANAFRILIVDSYDRDSPVCRDAPKGIVDALAEQDIVVRTPPRGLVCANLERARMLGIRLDGVDWIELLYRNAVVLKPRSRQAARTRHAAEGGARFTGEGRHAGER